MKRGDFHSMDDLRSQNFERYLNFAIEKSDQAEIKKKNPMEIPLNE